MKKVIRDGKVAVIYSPGFGAGWSTWGAPEELLFDPEVVALVAAGKHKEIEPMLKERGYNFFMGGAEDLEIVWIEEGTQFKIEEYDGNESIQYRDADDWYFT